MSGQNDVKFETRLLEDRFCNCAKIHFLTSLLAKMICLSKGDLMNEKLGGHFARVSGVILRKPKRFRTLFCKMQSGMLPIEC